MPVKVKIVFEDWKDQETRRSIYNTKEGIELSMGDFHSGTTFDGTMEFSEGEVKELKRAIKDGYHPVFTILFEDT